MRPDDPDLGAVHHLAAGLFAPTLPVTVERVTEGVSTFVYRVRRGTDTFYLRVLPEDGATFAPEVLALDRLRAAGVRVPTVIAYEPVNALLGRSVMLTTAILGASLARLPVTLSTRHILVEAGQQLALLNRIPVEGFGWVRRDAPGATRLEGEHPTMRAFMMGHLADDLAALAGAVLDPADIERIAGIVAQHDAWLDAEAATLAHGDFDVTPIMQADGRYTGLIDFGEIRGADRWYDLGHFLLHDGETLPVAGLDWLLEGYQAVTPLPDDHRRRISFASLLIAVRALGRHMRLGRPDARQHQGSRAIARDLADLYA